MKVVLPVRRVAKGITALSGFRISQQATPRTRGLEDGHVTKHLPVYRSSFFPSPVSCALAEKRVPGTAFAATEGLAWDCSELSAAAGAWRAPRKGRRRRRRWPLC